MDSGLIKNSAVNKSVRNTEKCVTNSDNYVPKQNGLSNSNEVALTSLTSTGILQNTKLGEKSSIQNSSYQIFNNLSVLSRFHKKKPRYEFNT
jgi:hypothetical protein